MKKFYVYVHTCNANGKRYVGVTTASKPEFRWGKNGEGYKSQLFGKAVRKHGWNNFQHEVFEVDSAEEMYRKEVELISFYHSNDPEFGYNLSSGGEKGALGCIRSEEVRKNMSEAQKKVQKKVHSDPEYRKHLSEGLKGRPHKPFGEEHKKHLSEAQKKVQKKVHSDLEYRKRISEAQKEKYLDPEYRKYRSKVQKKVHLDPEYRRKVSEAKKGKPHKPFSAEHKRHIAEAAKNRPRVKIKLPDGTIVETTKSVIVRNYVNKGRKFEYVS